LPTLVLAGMPALAADKPTARKPAAAQPLAAPRAPVADARVRIARGDIVPAYRSAWRAAELAALRPAWADLKPRARTNQE
jgi:hypothetical protein